MAIGNLDYVAREVVKAEDVVDYSPKEGIAERLARRIGTAMGEAIRPWAKENIRVR